MTRIIFASAVAALAAVAAFSSSLSYASPMIPTASAITRVSPAPECRTPGADAFELGARAKQGLDQGKCLKQDYRHLIILSEQEKQTYQVPTLPGHVAVANVMHTHSNQTRHFIANIPIHSAFEARYLTERFLDSGSVFGAFDPSHGMTRILFSKDITLYEQNLNKLGPVAKVRDLNFSVQVNAHAVINSQHVKRLLDGSFALVGTLSTFDGRFRDVKKPQITTIDQWKLSMPPSDVVTFASRFIERADRNGFRRPYLLMNNNCVSEIFVILDRMYRYSDAQLQAIVDAAEGEWIPSEAPKSFVARGLLNMETGKLPPVNDEI